MRGRILRDLCRWVLALWSVHGIALVSLPAQSFTKIQSEVKKTELKIRIHEADPKATVNRPYKITYEIAGEGLSNLNVASKPSGANMEMVYDAVSRGESVSIVNGKVSRSSQVFYSYTFIPNQKGKVTLSGFSIKGEDGSVVAAPSFQLVVEADNQAHGRESRGMQSVSPTRKPSFLYRVVPSRKSVYENELFSVAYRIYLNTSISNHSLDQAPDFKNFISKEVDQDPTQRSRFEEYNGQTYSVVDYFVSLLEADSAGTKTLPTSKITLFYPSDNQANDMFMREIVSKSLSTDPVTIEVKPLPQDGRPKDFSGIVGRFDVTISPQECELRTGSAKILKLSVKGEGNLSRLSAPKLELPLELEAYPPKESMDVKLEKGKILASKEFTYSLIAHKAGDYTIPSISISYFDPILGAYKRISTKPVHIKAEGEAVGGGVYQSAEAGAVDQLPLMDGVGKKTLQGSSFARSYLYLLCYLVLSVLAYVVYRLFSLRRRAMADVDSWRASRAEKLAKRRLRSALYALKQKDEHQALEELLSALWGYLGDKLRLSTSQLTRENIGSLLSSNGISDELNGEVLALIDELEFVCFAPSSSHSDPMDLYERAERLIVRLEENKLVVHA